MVAAQTAAERAQEQVAEAAKAKAGEEATERIKQLFEQLSKPKPTDVDTSTVAPAAKVVRPRSINSSHNGEGDPPKPTPRRRAPRLSPGSCLAGGACSLVVPVQPGWRGARAGAACGTGVEDCAQMRGAMCLRPHVRVHT